MGWNEIANKVFSTCINIIHVDMLYSYMGLDWLPQKKVKKYIEIGFQECSIPVPYLVIPQPHEFEKDVCINCSYMFKMLGVNALNDVCLNLSSFQLDERIVWLLQYRETDFFHQYRKWK